MNPVETLSLNAKNHPLVSGELRMILQQATCSAEKGYLYRASYDAWCEQDAVLHVARIDGKIVGGCATLGDKSASLTAMVVEPEARGHKIGHAVLKEAIAYRKKAGACVIKLDVRATSNGLPKHAVTLYRSFGFRMLPGVIVTAVKWALVSSHLWGTSDEDGSVFRNRVMQLDLGGVC